jgi:hypothetical protein
VKTRRSLVTLLVVALLGGLAAGCGGSDEPTVAEFQVSVVTTRDRVDYALARIPKAQSREETLNRMDEASAAISAASDEFQEAGAPEQFEEDATKLGESLDQLSVDLAATASDLGNPELGFEELPVGFEFESWNQANRALAAMIGNGIKVELIGNQ